jgi:ureidoglycolate lyase
MESITIKAQPLNKENFAPYGEVIETEGARHFGMNDGMLERYYDLAHFDVDHKEGGRVVMSITTCTQTSSMPYKVPCIEKHPKGSQAFIPMNESPIIIAVTEPSETVDLSKLKAFISNGKQGINYNKNVWHIPAICLDKEQQFIILDRGGPGENCDVVNLDDAEIIITL